MRLVISDQIEWMTMAQPAFSAQFTQDATKYEKFPPSAPALMNRSGMPSFSSVPGLGAAASAANSAACAAAWACALAAMASSTAMSTEALCDMMALVRMSDMTWEEHEMVVYTGGNKQKVVKTKS